MFKILTNSLLKEYKSHTKSLKNKLDRLNELTFTKRLFDYYLSVHAAVSSAIENVIDDPTNYFKYKTGNRIKKTKSIELVDALYEAYKFAQNHNLSRQNLLKAHEIFALNLEPEARGKIRKKTGLIANGYGKIIYICPNATETKRLFNQLFEDISKLLETNLDTHEIFYFAALIHLAFVIIHPFEDGNGRSARLLEKWFLSHFLGKKAWAIPSESFYYKNLSLYYASIRKVSGTNYSDVDYSKALPFLLMLPDSLSFAELSGWWEM